MLKLSKNITNIIYKYNDTSIENLSKIRKNVKYNYNINIRNFSILDMIIKLYQYGYGGFYVENTFHDLIKHLISRIDDDRIKVFNAGQTTQFYLEYSTTLINIIYLTFIDKRIKISFHKNHYLI